MLSFTWHDNCSVLVQTLEKVLLQGVVVERAVDVGRSDGGVGHANLGEVRLALELALVPALRVRGVLLFVRGVWLLGRRRVRGVCVCVFVCVCASLCMCKCVSVCQARRVLHATKNKKNKTTSRWRLGYGELLLKGVLMLYLVP